MKRVGLWTALITSASFALWSQPAIAGDHRITFVIAPYYTFCVSQTSSGSCSSVGRAAVSAEYRPFVSRRRDLRLKVTRGYVQATDEGLDESADLSQTQPFNIASEAFSLRARFFDDAGFERSEARVGYQYQYGSGSSPADVGLYGSDLVFFGKRIRRGYQAPARQFGLLLKVAEHRYLSTDLPQTFVQIRPSATFPWDERGLWRGDVRYTIQRQFAGPGTLLQPSHDFAASITHDFSAMLKAYVRFESNSSTNVVFGAELTL